MTAVAELFRRVPRNVLWPGVSGAAMLAVGGLGAGAIVRRDPLLSGTVLNAMRYGHDLAFIVLFAGLTFMVLSWVRLGRLVLAREVGGRDGCRVDRAADHRAAALQP